jgi:serine/threonine protein kinase
LPVYGAGRDADDCPFYVMKKIEGKTLEEIIFGMQDPVASIQRRTRLLNILLDACYTVAAAHEKGIVHRDIKPSNILVDNEGAVYVIDWGIAKRTGATVTRPPSELTLPGDVMGTPGYMSPEQADGRSGGVGVEADVFALGTVLYEILTGKRPFMAGDSRAELLGAIYEKPEPPRRINVLIPRDLNAICLKALHKDPASRYPNARGLAEDLRAHLEGRPVSVVRPNLIERIHYASRRRPMRTLVISSSLVSIGLLALFIGMQHMIDHRLADKAMDRLVIMDQELDELTQESAILKERLKSPDISEAERIQLTHELTIVEARWLLGQFEAQRVLASVADLRFIQTESEIIALSRKRMMTTIQAAVDSGRPALAEAIIATLLERREEGTLVNPLTEEDLRLLQRLADQAKNTKPLPEP